MKLGQRIARDVSATMTVMLFIADIISAIYLIGKLLVWFFFSDASWDEALTIAVIVTASSILLTAVFGAIWDHYSNLQDQSPKTP